MASSEVVPFAKTGGLGDVVGALSGALARLGIEVAVVLPAYKSILESAFSLQETGMEVEAEIADRRVRGVVLKTALDGEVAAYLIRADQYFLRTELYGTAQGDYEDNAERFVFFSKAALDLAQKTSPWDVIHCHDWQTALIPALKKIRPELWPEINPSRTVLTIHNLAYQGSFPSSFWPLLNLDTSYFSSRHLEFYGNFNCLKGGIFFADALTTVSRKYSKEILESEYGAGLEGVLRDRRRDLYGILNGVDTREWNPKSDPNIKKNYDAANPRGKESCKKDLQETFHLPADASIPLIGMVTRLAEQKGLDILADAMEALMQLDLQLVLLGAGEQRYHDLLTSLAAKHPKKLGVKIAFDDALAHKIEAGADLFLMPSRYEPCGLNQIYSLAYGTLPVVRATGGLDDTIEDYNPSTGIGTGFKFAAYSAPALVEAVKRALSVYARKEIWRKITARAMAADFSWEKSAGEYLALYRKLVERSPG
jgi:starch synthase